MDCKEVTYEEWCEHWGLLDYDPYDPFGDYEQNDFDDFMEEYYGLDDKEF